MSKKYITRGCKVTYISGLTSEQPEQFKMYIQLFNKNPSVQKHLKKAIDSCKQLPRQIGHTGIHS